MKGAAVNSLWLWGSMSVSSCAGTAEEPATEVRGDALRVLGESFCCAGFKFAQ